MADRGRADSRNNNEIITFNITSLTPGPLQRGILPSAQKKAK